MEMILLGGINRLGVKLPICASGGFSLSLRFVTCVTVIRRQSVGHSRQALDTQPKQLRLVRLQLKFGNKAECNGGNFENGAVSLFWVTLCSRIQEC